MSDGNERYPYPELGHRYRAISQNHVEIKIHRCTIRKNICSACRVVYQFLVYKRAPGRPSTKGIPMASYSKLPLEVRYEILEKIPVTEWQSFNALRRSDPELFAACNDDGTQRFHPTDSLRSGRFAAVQSLTLHRHTSDISLFKSNIFVHQLARCFDIFVPNDVEWVDYSRFYFRRHPPYPPPREPTLFSVALWNQVLNKAVLALSNPDFVCKASMTKEQERVLRNARIPDDPSLVLHARQTFQTSRRFLRELHVRMKRASRPQRLRVLAMRDPERAFAFRYSRGRYGRDKQLGHYRVLDHIDNELYGLTGELTSPYIEEVICADLEILLEMSLWWTDLVEGGIDTGGYSGDPPIRYWQNVRAVDSCVVSVFNDIVAKLWGKEEDRHALKMLADAGEFESFQRAARQLQVFHLFCNGLVRDVSRGVFGKISKF